MMCLNHLASVSDISFLKMPSSFSRVLQKCLEACSSPLHSDLCAASWPGMTCSNASSMAQAVTVSAR